jgi:hypothetical protein
MVPVFFDAANAVIAETSPSKTLPNAVKKTVATSNHSVIIEMNAKKFVSPDSASDGAFDTKCTCFIPFSLVVRP